MNAIELLCDGFDHLHNELRTDMSEIDPRDLWMQPRPGMNHAGFLFWHIVRDEDTVVSHVTGRPELWLDGWHERLALDSKDQGTGMDPERVDAFRYDMPLFLLYADAVWAATRRSLSPMAEAHLDSPAWPGSDWNVGQQLVEGCLGHGWLHLGEIRYLKGLSGWRFRE